MFRNPSTFACGTKMISRYPMKNPAQNALFFSNGINLLSDVLGQETEYGHFGDDQHE